MPFLDLFEVTTNLFFHCFFPESNFSSEKLQDCCVRGFTLLPMSRTCQERTRRVSQSDPDGECAEVFLKCCLEGERLRQIKINEDARKGFGRSEIKVPC